MSENIAKNWILENTVYVFFHEFDKEDLINYNDGRYAANIKLIKEILKLIDPKIEEKLVGFFTNHARYRDTDTVMLIDFEIGHDANVKYVELNHFIPFD